jgi:hypothetical protein
MLGSPSPLLPKQETELWVQGGGNMKVGLLAVDKAVYFLKDERSLTRDKVTQLLYDYAEVHEI